ncbi:MAG: hypothetical protein HRU19_10015 [Pseudobacteriovorax sp.]|nr:hypothetical protein [Pseudobacteriovorax sp.]
MALSRDWRAESVNRGVKLLIYFTPIFLASLFAQSKTISPLTTKDRQIKSNSSVIKINHIRQTTPGSVHLKISADQLEKKSIVGELQLVSESKRIKKRFKTRVGRLFRVNTKDIPKENLLGMRVRLTKASIKSFKDRQWVLTIMGNQPLRPFSVFDMIALLFIPSLVLVIFGLVMLVVPRLLKAT